MTATRATQRAPRAPLRRWAILGSLVVVLVGAGLVDRTVSRAGLPAEPATVASLAAPVGSESSSWYCAGSPGAAGGGNADTVLLTNTGAEPVAGTITVSNNAGASKHQAIQLPAREEVAVNPSSLESGDWLGSAIDLDGGGVAVTQLVKGPTGWSESACASTPQPNWYFASGSTATGAVLVLTLYNPTSAPAVVDTSFETPQGSAQPQPYQGVVVSPGQVVALNIGSYVQNASSVSTVVSARSGRIVAEELQTLAVSGQAGLTLRLGAVAPRQRWFVASNVDPTGTTAATQFDAFNPTAGPELVTMSARLAPSSGASGSAIGAVVTFHRELAPGATWHLRTQGSPRIVAGTPFSMTVQATGGAGVVVERIQSAPGVKSTPQWGVTPSLGGATAAGAAGSGSTDGAARWVVPAPGAGGSPAVAGAQPLELTVQNVTGNPVQVRLSALATGVVRTFGTIGDLTVPPGSFVAVPTTLLAATAGDPLVVQASGRVVVLEDLSPAAAVGVVTFGGVPLAPG